MHSAPRALVVVPTPALQQPAAAWAAARGFAVHTLSTFEAARRAIERDPPWLLVTELRLGAFNGLHLAAVARSCAPDLTILVLGYDDPVLRREADALGVQYLVGPFDAAALDAALQAAWADRPGGGRP